MGTTKRYCRRHRGMLQQNVVDLMRRDVFARADDDVFNAPGQVQVTVAVEITLVSGAKPAVDEGAGVGFRIIFVSTKYVCALDCDFAAFIILERLAVFVHDPDAEARAHSHRPRLAVARRQRIRSHLMRRFGHAISFHKRHAKFVFDFMNQFRRQRRAARTNKAQSVSFRWFVVRARHQKLVHRGHSRIPRDAMFPHRPPES